MQLRDRHLALPALLLANATLAMGAWLVRIASDEGGVGPVASGFWRLTLALPFLVIAARMDRAPRLPNKRALILTALLSGLFFGADLGVWHAGILHTRLANATLLGNCTAILFPAYGFLVARALPSGKQAIALLLATIGALLLLGRSYELSARNLVGDLLCLSAGIFYTMFLVAADRARSALGALTTLAWSVVAGIPVLLIAALLLGDPIWPRLWWPLVVLALGSQIVGQGLILYAVNRTSPLVIGFMLLLQPAVAATVGWLAYGERLKPLDVVGAAAIGLAVLLVRDSSHAPARWLIPAPD